MNKLSKYLIWFYMLTKRLLRQWSFVLLLCLIPCSILLTNIAMSEESGVVHILLCAEGNDAKTKEIIDNLINDDSIIRFSLCESPEEAEKIVANHKADAAWIFADDFTKKIDEYVKKSDIDEPFIRIIESESTIFSKIAKEKLFGEIYDSISYSIYENFVYSNIVSEEKVPQATLEKYYNKMQKGKDIVEIEHLNATPNDNKVTYLTAPIRGILALMVVLCTLTSAMIFLREQSQGKFSWLPVRKRIIPAIASCFSAACLSALAAFITIQFSDISTSIGKEFFSMLLYILSVTGFCTVLLTFFKSSGKFGATIPGIIIVMLVLSPIFFNIKVLRPVRLMLPTHYYINSIYETTYYFYTLIYCFVIYTIAIISNYILAERKNDDSKI